MGPTASGTSISVETRGVLAGRAPFERTLEVAEKPVRKSQGDGASLLAGLLYDETGDRLSPSHAIKNGVRYRYYISQRLMQARRKDATAWRLPAKAVEDLVVAELAGLLEHQRQLHSIIEADRLTIHELEAVTAKARLLSNCLLDRSELQIKAAMRSIVDRITTRRIHHDHIE